MTIQLSDHALTIHLSLMTVGLTTLLALAFGLSLASASRRRRVQPGSPRWRRERAQALRGQQAPQPSFPIKLGRVAWRGTRPVTRRLALAIASRAACGRAQRRWAFVQADLEPLEELLAARNHVVGDWACACDHGRAYVWSLHCIACGGVFVVAECPARGSRVFVPLDSSTLDVQGRCVAPALPAGDGLRLAASDASAWASRTGREEPRDRHEPPASAAG